MTRRTSSRNLHCQVGIITGLGISAACSASCASPRDACHAHGRQRAANCSLSGGDQAMNAWDTDPLAELEAECTNDGGQSE